MDIIWGCVPSTTASTSLDCHSFCHAKCQVSSPRTDQEHCLCLLESGVYMLNSGYGCMLVWVSTPMSCFSLKRITHLCTTPIDLRHVQSLMEIDSTLGVLGQSLVADSGDRSRCHTEYYAPCDHKCSQVVSRPAGQCASLTGGTCTAFVAGYSVLQCCSSFSSGLEDGQKSSYYPYSITFPYSIVEAQCIRRSTSVSTSHA